MATSQIMSRARFVLSVASAESTTIRITVARSCTVDQASVRRPWGESISPVSPTILTSTVLDEIETTAPKKSDSSGFQPSKSPTPKPIPMIASIWTVAPMVATLPERSSSASESSTPIANMSRMMPISARAVTVSSAATKPGVYGADRDAGEDIAEDDRLAETGSKQRADEAGPEREYEIDEEARILHAGADLSSGVRIGASAGQRRCSGQSNWRHKAKAMRNPAAGEPQRGNRGTLPPFSQPKPKSRN